MFSKVTQMSNAVGSLVRTVSVSCCVERVEKTLDQFSFDWDACKHIMTAHLSVIITTAILISSPFSLSVVSLAKSNCPCAASTKLYSFTIIDVLNDQIYMWQIVTQMAAFAASCLVCRQLFLILLQAQQGGVFLNQSMAYEALKWALMDALENSEYLEVTSVMCFIHAMQSIHL